MQNNEKDFNYFFRLDILKLFSAFNHIDSFRFSDFIIIWNEMKFFQLFALVINLYSFVNLLFNLFKFLVYHASFHLIIATYFIV